MISAKASQTEKVTNKKAEKLKLDGYDIEIISESVFYDMANIP